MRSTEVEERTGGEGGKPKGQGGGRKRKIRWERNGQGRGRGRREAENPAANTHQCESQVLLSTYHGKRRSGDLILARQSNKNNNGYIA